MKKGIMRVLAGVLCMAMLLADGSLVYAIGQNDYFAEDSTEVISEEVSEEASEDASEEVSGEASEEVREELSEEATEEASEETSEEPSEESSEEASEEPSEETTEELTENASEESNGATPQFPGLGAAYAFRNEIKEERIMLQDKMDITIGGVEGEDYVSNQILVAASDEAEAELFAAAFGGTLIRYVADIAVIELNADGESDVTVDAAVMASADPKNCLPAAWPNTIHRVAEIKDPALSPENDNYQWQQDATDAEYAWAKGYTGKGVKVAVLDTGIREGHEDLNPVASHVTSDDKTVISNGVLLAPTPDDLYVGHGTHVSGIIGATYGNGKGGAGIAPDVELYSCNVFTVYLTCEADDIIEGMQWAMDNDVEIINMSLQSDRYNYYFQQKISEAYAAGIAVFCAAGNVNTNGVVYPAAYKDAICIAALDVGLQKAFFSSYGDKVRYAFPGVDVYSTVAGIDADNNGRLDELCTNQYCMMSGTSMASPVASGVAAVVLQYAKENGLLEGCYGKAKVDKLLEIMDSNCVSVKGEGLGKGMVSFSKLVGATTMEMKPAKPEIVANAGGTYTSEWVSVEVAKQDGMYLCYTLDGSNPVYKDWKTGPKTHMIHMYESRNVELQVGDKAKMTLKLMAVNPYTGKCSDIVTQKYVFQPSVRRIGIVNKSGKDILNPGESTTLSINYFPSFASAKSVEWSMQFDETGVTVNSKGVVKVKKNAESGYYFVRAVLKSNRSVETTYMITVEKPAKKITAITSEVKSYTIWLGSDAMLQPIQIATKDGSKVGPDALNWKVSNPDALYIYPEKDCLRVYGNKRGKVTLTGTATDGSKKKITLTITVTDHVYMKGSQYGILKGKTATYQIYDVNEKKMSSSLFAWSVEPAGQGVTVTNGKVKVDKNTSITHFTLRAVNKELSELETYIVVSVCDTQVKTVSVAKEYRNLSLTRMQGKAVGRNQIEIPYTIRNGTYQDVVIQSEKGLVSCSWSDTAIYIYAGKYCGTDTISINSLAGNKTLCKITVKVVNPVSGFEVTFSEGRSAVLTYKKSMKLVPCFGTSYGAHTKPEETLTWHSENPDVIKVDKKGKITAVGYEGTATIVAESVLYGVRAELKITATDVVKKIWLSTVELDTTSTTLPNDVLYICADLQHRKEDMTDINYQLLPIEYYEALDVFVDGEDVVFSFYVVTDDVQQKEYLILSYDVNRPGKYTATVKLRDGNTAKGKMLIDCRIN